jgi:hypothetical protein
MPRLNVSQTRQKYLRVLGGDVRRFELLRLVVAKHSDTALIRNHADSSFFDLYRCSFLGRPDQTVGRASPRDRSFEAFETFGAPERVGARRDTV